MEPFALERYFARHEFTAPFLLSASDTEPLALSEVLSRVDPDVRDRWASLSLGYTESRGLPALREAIARFTVEASDARDAAVSADDVLVFSCAEEAIYATMRTHVRPGGSIACTWPAYQSLYEVARTAGASIRPIPARIVGARWDLLADDIDAAVVPGTCLVVANAPHNPTGMVPSPGAWERLRRRAAAVGALFVADEVYRPLAAPGTSLHRCPATDPVGPTLAIGSVSKAFGMAGVRIGWVVSNHRSVLASLESYKDYTTICASAPSEVLALAALRQWREFVGVQAAIVDANRRALAEALPAMAGLVEAAPSAAGSTAFPRWSGPGDADAMAARAVGEAGIMVLPGSIFDPGGVGPGLDDLRRRFRVGLGRRNLPEVLGRFVDHLRRAYGA